MAQDIEQIKKMQQEFLKGGLNFPVGTHESVASVLGLPVEQVQKVRDGRLEEARRRIKLRETVDNKNIKHTVWDARGLDFTIDGNCLTVGQLKQVIANMPDDMNVYTEQYIASIGMEGLPCACIQVADSFKYGDPGKKQTILVIS
jgi:hypothetical protein